MITPSEAILLMGCLNTPIRMQILITIAERPGITIKEICAALGRHQPDVSSHLQLARAAGFVETVRLGRYTDNRIGRARIEALIEFLRETFCQEGKP